MKDIDQTMNSQHTLLRTSPSRMSYGVSIWRNRTVIQGFKYALSLITAPPYRWGCYLDIINTIKNLNLYVCIPLPHEHSHHSRAGVLILSTRTRSTRVLNLWYSYCTRTHEFQSHSTCTCTRTRGQVLRYLYEYWHEY